ncbi:MAG: efflux RND transporter permease subunit [Caldilineaceae bacterium]
MAAVDVSGGEVREIQVNLNFQNMAARRIAVQQVIGALRTENLNIPGGSVTDGGQKLLVRTPGNFETVDQLNDIIVGQSQTAPVYLRDVAQVVDGFQEREELTRLNGEESVTIAIRKQSGSNSLAVADGVKETLNAITAANPDLEIVIGGDESVIVRESTNGAISDLLGRAAGCLHHSDLLSQFAQHLSHRHGHAADHYQQPLFMELADISLNNVSLLALALVIGLIIDDGIVVRENILRWIERGYKPRDAASLATAEVIQPVIATTATILAVFLPVAYASGIIGRFFRSFGLTVSIAIVISTFEALTLAPMMAARFFKASTKVPEGQIDESIGREEAGRGWLDRLYSATLNWTLDHRWLTLLVAALIVAGSVYGAGFIQQAFLPSLDRGVFDVAMKMPPGTPLEITEREAIKVEEIIQAHPWVDGVFTTIGSSAEPERASFFVKVRRDAPGQSPSERVIDDLRQPLAAVPGVSFALADGVGGGDTFIDGSKAIVVELISPTATFQELGEISQRLMADITAQVPGLVDVTSSYNAGKPEVQIAVDRRRAADAGLSTAQIGSSLRTLVNGEKASTFRGEGAEADIIVRLRPEDRARIDDLLDIGLVAPTGNLIQLRTVAAAQVASGPTQIQRRNREPIVSIGANVVGRSTPDAVDDVTNFLAAYPFPAGVEAKLGGDADAQAESFQNLGMALLLSVVFIYMVLAAQFGSFIQPLLIMIAMPLSIIGALLALLMTDRPLDMTAFIGFIMLMGLVTKNSILLVDFANMERDRGAAADLAMRRAGPVRLRPILMTALSLILAMIPVVMGISAGGEFRQSMSIAIMGGMITSTLLTLYVVPVAYSLVIGLQDRGKTVQRYRQGTNLDLIPTSSSHLALAPTNGRSNLELTPTENKGLQISDSAMGD